MKLCTPTSCGPALGYRQSPFAGLFRHPLAGVPSLAQLFDLAAPASEPRSLSLATDVFEDDAHYFARFEVPGVKKEDIRIELKDRELSVAANRTVRTDDGDVAHSLARSLSVPAGIASDAITAKLENGILTLTLPKPAEQKPRAITIE